MVSVGKLGLPVQWAANFREARPMAGALAGLGVSPPFEARVLFSVIMGRLQRYWAVMVGEAGLGVGGGFTSSPCQLFCGGRVGWRVVRRGASLESFRLRVVGGPEALVSLRGRRGVRGCYGGFGRLPCSR